MLYVYFKNAVILSCYYEEPIYNQFPGMGNYVKNIRRKMYKGVAEYDEQKQAIVLRDEYGDSTHGFTAYLPITTEEIAQSKDIMFVDHEFYERYSSLQESMIDSMKESSCMEEFIFLSDNISEEECKYLSENLLKTALKELHIESEIIKMQVVAV